jgi:hypothetical protein
MIIKSERKTPNVHVDPRECQDPLAAVEHHLLMDFYDFLAMHA